ncbi:hypothetical protein CTA2_8630 [Colletotrichum tanaceti]|nr:hypothetical protein CTA2_8630 [Colletotrichum tanaceti]
MARRCYEYDLVVVHYFKGVIWPGVRPRRRLASARQHHHKVFLAGFGLLLFSKKLVAILGCLWLEISLNKVAVSTWTIKRSPSSTGSHSSEDYERDTRATIMVVRPARPRRVRDGSRIHPTSISADKPKFRPWRSMLNNDVFQPNRNSIQLYPASRRKFDAHSSLGLFLLAVRPLDPTRFPTSETSCWSCIMRHGSFRPKAATHPVPALSFPELELHAVTLQRRSVLGEPVAASISVSSRSGSWLENKR